MPAALLARRLRSSIWGPKQAGQVIGYVAQKNMRFFYRNEFSDYLKHYEVLNESALPARPESDRGDSNVLHPDRPPKWTAIIDRSIEGIERLSH